MDTYCERAFLIRPEPQDVLVVSAPLARQIVRHNDIYTSARCP